MIFAADFVHINLIAKNHITNDRVQAKQIMFYPVVRSFIQSKKNLIKFCHKSIKSNSLAKFFYNLPFN